MVWYHSAMLNAVAVIFLVDPVCDAEIDVRVVVCVSQRYTITCFVR